MGPGDQGGGGSPESGLVGELGMGSLGEPWSYRGEEKWGWLAGSWATLGRVDLVSVVVGNRLDPSLRFCGALGFLCTCCQPRHLA